MTPLKIIFLGSELRRDELLPFARAANLEIVATVFQPESLAFEVEHDDAHVVVITWESPFSDWLIDVLDLMPHLPLVAWNLSGEKKQVLQSMGLVGVVDQRHLDGGLLHEMLDQAMRDYDTGLELKEAKLKLSELRMDEWDRKEKLERERQALLSLARYKFQEGNFKTGLKKVARLCLEMLAVDRVSIWLARRIDGRFHHVVEEGLGEMLEPGVLLEEEPSEVYLEDLSRGEPMAMSTLKGLSLYKNQQKVLLNGERTSLVDAPIFFNGQVKGILRAEQKDGPRDWQMENLNFIDALADVVSLALEQEERLKVTQQLREKEALYLEQLEKSNEELQEFASVVSHDLQEPLYKVGAFGDVLLKQHTNQLNDEGKFIVSRIKDAGDRMSSLISNLLTYSKISSQERPFEVVDLNVVVRGVLEDLEVRVVQMDAEIKVDHLPRVYADPMQMRQLFQNLIGNALKFAKSGQAPWVHVQYECEKEHLIFRVVDRGVGFDPQYSKSIFGVFQRANVGRERQGTGVGLAIAKKVALRHKGSISAQSKVSEGAEFEVRFPKEMVCLET